MVQIKRSVISLCFHLSLLKSILPNHHISATRSTALKTPNLFRTFNSLLCPPPPPPTTSIIADDYATFFTEKKTEQLVVSSHLHTHRTSNQPHPLLKLRLLLLSPHWTSPLQPSYNVSFRPSPHTPSPSNLSLTLTSTHTHYQHISPHRHFPHVIQTGSGYPTAQETYIKHFSYRKLKTYLSPSIRSQNTQTSCFQSVIIVSFTEQQTGR